MEAEGVNRNVSIKVLRSKTKDVISHLLNPRMFLPTDNGILRDWQGLAGLCKLDSNDVDSLDHYQDKTQKVLNLWYQKDPQSSTIKQFISFLEEMDRFDVIDDAIELIDEDIQTPEIIPQKPEIEKICLDADKIIITRDDVRRVNAGLALENYDAFLLFDQDDIDFASLVLENMERDYNMKFCVKDRDLVGGGLEVDTIITLITERCKRVVVILSDALFKSSVNEYFVKFAQAFGIENKRKLIPIEYKDVTIKPEAVKYLCTLNYKRRDIFNFNFWDRLRDTIMVGDPDKIKIARSKSDNGQTFSHSALQENRNGKLRPLHHTVKFRSDGDLNNLDSLDTKCEPSPINPSTSADNLESLPDHKKEKKNLIQRIKRHWKKEKHTDCMSAKREKNKLFTKHWKRATAVAN